MNDSWQYFMTSERTNTLKIWNDEEAGFLLNLFDKVERLASLDAELATINYSSRDRFERPVTIVSENHLEVLSYPKNENRDLLIKFNEVIHDNNNMIGHMVVPQKEVEVTAGFAGAKENLVWFNTGDLPLMFSLRTDKVTKSLLLDPGLGFCVGKRERFVRVFLSSIDIAEDLFVHSKLVQHRSHALFFGNYRGIVKVAGAF